MNQEKFVLSIQDFCQQNGISRNHLYVLWSRGDGPVTMRVGRRRLISKEAAAEWRKRMEGQSVVNQILEIEESE